MKLSTAGLDLIKRSEGFRSKTYLDIAGHLPEDRDAMLEALRRALKRDESAFRPFFVGTQ